MIDWKRAYVKEGVSEAVHESFAKKLKRLRTAQKLSQQGLSEQLHVSRSTVASWETGLRLPSAVMILRIARCLSADPTALISAAEEPAEKPGVLLVDPDRISRSSSLFVLEEVLPNAAVTCFTDSSEALAFARSEQAALVFLETRIGADSGLTLCRELLKLDPRTNVIFLTDYPEDALEAWGTGACGFLLKPMTPDALGRQRAWLRHPVRGLTEAPLPAPDE